MLIDLRESAGTAVRETAIVLWRLVGVIIFGLLFSLLGAALVAATFFVLRWLYPHVSTNNAVAISVMLMIFPISAIGWFGIVFSVEFEQRRRRRERNNDVNI